MEEILGYKMRIDTLKQINNGFNFGNLNEKKKTSKYFIKVLLISKMNLKEKREELEVRHDLFSNYSYHSGQDVIDFLKALEEFAKKPIAKVRHFNRKSQINTYGFSDKFRDKTIKFSDIEISIGELAEEKLKKMEMDFKEDVKKALSLQKKDETAQKLLDRFVILKEKMLTLDECVGKQKNDYGYYREEKDKTMKMTLTPFQYNNKLKEIETEIREIAGKLGIPISDYDFKYIPIPKKVGFDEWFKANKFDLEESWAMFDEDERKEYKNLKGYGEMVYDECGGEIIEGSGDNEDFDEEDEDEEE